MAKKTHLKVRMVPETIRIVSLFIMQRNLLKVKKLKNKLKLKKYNPNTRKHEYFVEKKLPPHSK